MEGVNGGETVVWMREFIFKQQQQSAAKEEVKLSQDFIHVFIWKSSRRVLLFIAFPDYFLSPFVSLFSRAYQLEVYHIQYILQEFLPSCVRFHR